MLPVGRNERILFAGDSLIAGTSDQNNTSWPFCTNGFIAQINAKLGTTQVGPRRIGGGLGAFPKVGGVQARINGGAPITINRGVAGWTSASVFADKVNIPIFKPTIIVLAIGINDAVNGVITPAQTRTNVDGTLDYYQEQLPGVQLMVVEPFLWGEQWTAVGPALNNAHDAAITLTNAQIQQSAANHGATWVATRAAALTYLMTWNTPAPGAQYGYLMDSLKIHPTYPTSQIAPSPLSGMEFIANLAFAQVTVTP